MSARRRTLPVLFIFFYFGLLRAQDAAHVPGEFLVRLFPGYHPAALVQEYRTLSQTGASLDVVKQVSTFLNVWQLRIHTSGNDDTEKATLAWLRSRDPVLAAQFNHILELRQDSAYPPNLLPDDPLFPQQWQFINTGANNGLFDADLDAEQAWEITTGGLTPAGDTIVVAVIDGGLNYSHPDLAANSWRNWGEVPDDGLDNDNNGYIDDFRGWNTATGTDQIEGQSTAHGTPVSSIIGAVGDNGIGVSGVNWNVKVLFVSGSGTEDNILSAYDYIWQTRQRYNITHGVTGAFVVAINCSWGINYGQPADSPLWCAAFDALGEAGIISVAATANIPVNVDEVGDLPTACPSDYLIAVTSLNKSDEKSPNAAWGNEHIDLGAYGQGIFTAGSGNTYGFYDGTSFAAPHVAGMVGLLYASPCPGLIALAKTQPGSAALWAKSMILAGATSTPSMAGLTATGGRLNLFNPLQSYQDQCSPCQAPFALLATDITDVSTVLKWLETPDFQTIQLRYRKIGEGWTVIENASAPYLLDGLSACTGYEFSTSAVCSFGVSSGWSDPFLFKTEGCCIPPAQVWANAISDTDVSLAWTPVFAAQKYVLRIQPATGGIWQLFESASPGLMLEGLNPCMYYIVQVKTLCGSNTTGFSNTFMFTTSGCGACLEAAYCSAGAQQAWAEWIAKVETGDWVLSTTGASGGGYQNFTGEQVVVPVFHALGWYPTTVTPGFSGSPHKQYVRIFIDYNADGIFSSDELAFDPGFAHDGPVSVNMLIPEVITPGLTRMRVLMKTTNVADQAPEACEHFSFGQVEDYCVLLDPLVITSLTASPVVPVLQIWPQPAVHTLHIVLSGPEANPVLLEIWDMSGRLMLSGQHVLPAQMDISNWPAGLYMVRVVSGGKVWAGRCSKQ